MEYLCIALTVLFLIVALGHGVWVLAAWLFRQFGGSAPPRHELPPCPDCGRLLLSLERPCRWCGFDPESSTEQSLADLVATTRQLRRFLAAGKIDQATFDTLRGHILAERRRLRREEPERVPSVVAATATQQAEAPTNGEPPAEVITLEVDQAVEAPPPPLVRPVPSTPPPAAVTPPPFVLTAASVPAPEPPAEPPVITVPEPAAPPRLPRQPLRAMLTAFMEERNILWGELVGGLLIVGCSIALVVSLWPTLDKIPYSPFLIFAGITAALFGAGLYTLHHWKLASTSRGLLIIAALLVPLNFLVLAGLHRPDGGGLIEAGLEVIAVAIFAGLVRQAARVLVPEGGWLLPVGVLGCAGVQLLAAWLLPMRQSLAWVLTLGLTAVACQGASVGGLLWRLRSGEATERKLEPERASRLLLHLGISAFAVLVTLGLLSYGTAHLGAADLFGAVLDRLAVVVALAGVPILLTGLQVHTGLAEHEDAGAMRTAGTAVALAGMAVLLGGLALAWPQPLALIAVGGLDFLILTVVAFRWRLPVVHAAALPCLVLMCVTGALLLWQNVGRETLPAALYSADSGVICVGLFLLLGAGGEGLTRLGRRADAFFYVVTAAVVGVLGLILVSVPSRGITEPSRAMIVYALCGLAGFALNHRWRQPLVSSTNVALLVGTTFWGLFAFARDASVLPVWGAVLGGESLLCAWITTVLDRRGRSTTPATGSDDSRLTIGEYLAEPLARSAEALVLLVVVTAVAGGCLAGSWHVAHVLTGGSLCASLLILAAREGRTYLARGAGLMLAGTAVALAGWLAAPFAASNLLAWLALGLGVASVTMSGVALWTKREAGAAPWPALLSGSWRDTAAISGMAALALSGVAWWTATPWVVALPFFAVAAASFVLTRRDSQPAWTWIGSTILVLGLIRLSPVYSWVDLLRSPDFALALLGHATLALAVVTALRRACAEPHDQAKLPAGINRLFLEPLLQAALLSALLALAQTWMVVWPTRLAPALSLTWLAGLWLWLAGLRRSPLLFSVFQAVLCLAVLYGTTAWLAAQPWYGQDARTLHVYGIGLAMLAIAWMAVRVARPGNALASLLNPPWLPVDRIVLGALVLTQAALAVLGIIPTLSTELDAGSLSIALLPNAAPLPAGCFAASAWILLGVLILALAIGLWERAAASATAGLIILAITVPGLGAGPFSSAHAVRPALCWGLAGCFVGCSIVLLLREPVLQRARTLGCYVTDAPELPALCRGILIAGTVLPALGLTLTAATIRFFGGHVQAPLAGTFFDAVPWLVSLGVPLVLVSLGLVGHAIRERSPGYALAAGLVVNFTVTGGHALAIGHSASAAQLIVQLGQLTTLTFALWALAWSAFRTWLRRRSPWSDSPLAAPLLALQRGLGVAGNAMLMIGALALLASAMPSLHAWPAEVGTWLGWLALLSAIAAWSWPYREERRLVDPRALGLAGMAVVSMVACSVECLWPGWGYRAWMLGSGAFALGWALSVWRLTRAYPADADADFLAALVRATELWVPTAALLTVFLAVKAAFWQDDPLWGAAALALASPAGAIVGVWRRREPWAFAAGLGFNLAASLVTWYCLGRFAVPAAEAWVYLLEVNASAAAAVGLLWVRLRHQLYGPEGKRSTALLTVQIALPVALVAFLLNMAGWWLFLNPGRDWPADLLRIGEVGGWLAWFSASGAAAWYAVHFAPRRLSHLLAASIVGVGVVAATLFGHAAQHTWLSYHVLLGSWVAAGLGLLGLGWRLTRRHIPEGIDTDSFQVSSASRIWAMLLGAALAILALRAAWEDPARPYMSMLGALAASVLFALVALWWLAAAPVYVSGLLLNLAGLCAWITWGGNHLDSAAWTQALCFAIAASVWSVLEQTLGRAQELRGTWPPFTHLAASLALLVLTGLVALAVATTLFGFHAWAGPPLAWIALGATAVALACLLPDASALLAAAGLYLIGILALALSLHTADVGPRLFGWWTGLGLASYALLASIIPYAWQRQCWLTRSADAVVLDWFTPAQTVVALVAVGLSVWMSLDFGSLAQRLGGPLTVALLLPVGISLAGAQQGRVRHWMQVAVLLLGAVLAVEVGWSVLDPASYALASLWLRRNIALVVALALLTPLYGGLFSRRLPSAEWAEMARRLGPSLGLVASAVLLLVLAQEAWLYRAGSTVPAVDALGPFAIVIVMVALVTLFSAGLTFAVRPGADPFGLSERGRMAYVYAAEVLLVLMFVHLRLTAPGLFRLGLFKAYWPFVVLGLAFAGAGLGEFFRRRRLRVLAEPLERTGIGLPLLPVLAFWLVPAPRYATVWFLAGLLYGLISITRRSFRFALLAALSANAGLWVLLHHHEVFLWQHPQLWLIPPALILLVAEHLNRDRLGPYQSVTLRYLALSVVYVSSTADLFIAGIGTSWVLTLVLIVLCVLGILLGMLLRVRAFLFLGSAFLVLTIVLMIWHAGVDQRQAWILWSSGIVLGAAIVALFGVFEKRRDDVLRLVEQLKQWQ